jgi:RNA polymerase sigma-70 factor, ECF subfamily
MTERRAEATVLLTRTVRGDPGGAEGLIPLVYDELRALGRRFLQEEPPGLLQPTALVHEAYLKLVDQSQVDWKGRTHFKAIAARQMRRVLIDHARARDAGKRGGGRHRVVLDEAVAPLESPEYDAIDIEEALAELAGLDERQARIVELRFFGGLKVDEVGEALGISPKTVEKDWRMARAWLRVRLRGGPGERP